MVPLWDNWRVCDVDIRDRYNVSNALIIISNAPLPSNVRLKVAVYEYDVNGLLQTSAHLKDLGLEACQKRFFSNLKKHSFQKYKIIFYKSTKSWQIVFVELLGKLSYLHFCSLLIDMPGKGEMPGW